jgi:hypothetical protein
VEEGNGQRKIAEHFVLGAAGTANVLFSDDPNDSEGGGVAQVPHCASVALLRIVKRKDFRIKHFQNAADVFHILFQI